MPGNVAEEPVVQPAIPAPQAPADQVLAVVEKQVEKEPEEVVTEVTVDGLKNGTAKYELASRMLTLLTERKSWFLYIGTFAFFYFNCKGKYEVFSAAHLLATFGIVGGVSVAKDIIDKVRK